MTYVNRPNERIKKIGIVAIMTILVIIMASVLGYMAYRHTTGPVLKSHTSIGYYGHTRLKSLKTAGLTEKTAANKIYLTRAKVDWKHPIKERRTVYYFPKDMPKYTRRYIVAHD